MSCDGKAVPHPVGREHHKNGDPPLILLIHPPVYDFTAFDLFLYPLGLVHAAEFFMHHGFQVKIVDALDRFSSLPDTSIPPTSLTLPSLPGWTRDSTKSKAPALKWKPPTFRKDGCGHLYRTPIPPPPHLRHIPRRFHRFGLPRPVLEDRLKKAGRPEAVGITCSMTYWYPGVMETVDMARDLWPETPIILGGVYATLCPEHARKKSGVDFVHTGRSLVPALDFLHERVSWPTSRQSPPLENNTLLSSPGPSVPNESSADAKEVAHSAPKTPQTRHANETESAPTHTRFFGHDLMGSRTSAALQASYGCPQGCPYCAASLLGGPFRRRPIKEVLQEISFLVHEKGRKQIAFYDDALLEGEEESFLELTRGILAMDLHKKASFHCPNALWASGITDQVAQALKACNFHTLRIGFETADPSLQKKLGNKATNEDLKEAMKNLKEAGFNARDLGVYLLAGLPGQEKESVEASLRFVWEAGALSRMAEYAPVPGTPLFKKAKSLSQLDLDEPLNHNKTLAPFRFPTLTLKDLRELKDLARTLNQGLLDRKS